MFKFQNEYPHVNKAITLLFCLFVVTWYLEFGKRVSLFTQIRFEFFLGAVLGAIAVFYLISEKKDTPKAQNSLAPYVLFYFLTLLFSLPLSLDISRSWTVFVERILKFSCMTVFIAVFAKSPQQLKIFFASFFLAYLKVGQEAFYGNITGTMVWENQGIMRLHGAQGTMFGHPNSLSGKFLGTLPFIYYFYPLVKWQWKIFLLIQLVFVANITIFTGSRTGYIGLIFLCLIIIWQSNKKAKFVVWAFILCIVGIQFIPVQYKERFMSSFTGQEEEGRSRDARIELFKDSISVFIHNPFGVGIGCFQKVQRGAGHRAQETHNLYTQILSETGIQGFIAFSLLIYNLLNMLKDLKKRLNDFLNKLVKIRFVKSINGVGGEIIQQSISDLNFLFAVCSALSVFVYLRLVLGFFGHDLYEMYWWVAVGITISLNNICGVIEVKTKEILSYSTDKIPATMY